MDIWQIFLIGYLVVGAGMAVTVFRLRRTYSPLRTELVPSIVASFFSGMMWGIVLPLIVMRLFFAQGRRGEKRQ